MLTHVKLELLRLQSFFRTIFEALILTPAAGKVKLWMLKPEKFKSAPFDIYCLFDRVLNPILSHSNTIIKPGNNKYLCAQVLNTFVS